MNFKHIPNKKLIEVSKQTKDKKYLSVTGLTGKVSEKAILEWRKKVGEETANKIMTESSNRGTSIHNFCEHYLQNESIMIPEQNIPEYYTFKAMKPELNKINNIHRRPKNPPIIKKPYEATIIDTCIINQ